jgi:hypothetical protein
MDTASGEAPISPENEACCCKSRDIYAASAAAIIQDRTIY